MLLSINMAICLWLFAVILGTLKIFRMSPDPEGPDHFHRKETCMSSSRKNNAMKNILAGCITQMIMELLSFLGRTVFVQYLDISYLGINGLYGNILSVLALAELGLGNVTQFFLYKPVAEDDQEKISRLVRYFQKLYLMIAGAIIAIGLSLIPALKYIVNCDLPEDELIIYYVLFLVNSTISYFSAHKSALLLAYQDNRLQKYITVATSLLMQLLHIAVLALWHNYTVYLCTTTFTACLQVVLVNSISSRKYPLKKLSSAAKVSKEEKKYLAHNVKATFIYKIGGTIISNTDNILISVLVSTAAVGLYSNYFIVVMAIQGLLGIITTSLVPGIGNLSVSRNKKRMMEVLDAMLLVYHWVAAFGAISFYFLFDDLIPVWIGERFLLDHFTVFAIVLNFYIGTAICPVWMFREANGIFDKVKYLQLITAGVNIILSVIMGYLWGMAGILLATSGARLLTQIWYEPQILFGSVFQNSQRPYWKKQLWYVVLTLIASIICWGINCLLPHGFFSMILKGILFCIVCGSVFILGNIRSHGVAEMKAMVHQVLHGWHGCAMGDKEN